jgi:hypothetical protein
VVPDVASRVDVGGGGRAPGPVEVVGDRLRTELLDREEVEDLGDHGRLLGLGRQGDALLRAVAAVAGIEVVKFSPVAVGGAAAGAVSLLGCLAHPALGLPG